MNKWETCEATGWSLLRHGDGCNSSCSPTGWWKTHSHRDDPHQSEEGREPNQQLGQFAAVRALVKDGTLADACCVCEHGRMMWPAMGLEDVKLCFNGSPRFVNPLNTCDVPGRPCSVPRAAPGVVPLDQERERLEDILSQWTSNHKLPPKP